MNIAIVSGLIVLLVIAIIFCSNAYFTFSAEEEEWRYAIMTIQTIIISALIGCIIVVLGGCV